MQSEALLLTLFFVLAGISGASLMLFKSKVTPLRRSALLGHKKPSQRLILLTAMLFSLALISGCFAGALIGTLLSGQPAETIAARLNEEFLIIFFVSFAMVTLAFFVFAEWASKKWIASAPNGNKAIKQRRNTSRSLSSTLKRHKVEKTLSHDG
jgi:hypothetical protein